MPAVLLTVLTALGAALGKTVLHLITSLMTEKFFKTAIIAGLEKLVARTENDVDNKLLAAAKEAWSAEEKKNDDGK